MSSYQWIQRGLYLFLLNLLLLGGVAATSAPAPAGAVPAQQDSDLPLTTLYEMVAPSVVFIETLVEEAGFGTSFDLQGVGSGFVVDAEGHIVTNYHVVQDARRITVTFYDNTFARAEVVGQDPDSDIAVLKVEVDPAVLRPLILADSAQLLVGQEVVAIGNPFGETWTMTQGIISALGRSNPSLRQFSIANMIQTDAAINRGNSGGPLLDLQGRVIGVNTLIRSDDSFSAGVGFAVPANTVRRVLPDLISQGFYQYTWIGIQGRGLTLDEIELMELDPDVRGVLIARVLPNSPAARANLNANNRSGIIDGLEYPIGGDVITAIDDIPVQNMDELVNYLADFTRPGDEVSVSIVRDNQALIIPVTLEARPGP